MSHHGIWARFKKLTLANQANVVFGTIVMIATVSYSVVAAFQLHVMSRASVDSTRQAQQLIDSSTKSAQAAMDFAASAKKINTSLGTAVDKLQTQADQTRLLAQNALEQTKATRELTRQTAEDTSRSLASDRAWIYVSKVIVSPYTIGRSIVVSLTLVNSGKTPAVSVRSNVVGSDAINYQDESQKLDDLIAQATTQMSLLPDSVIPPMANSNVVVETPFLLTPERLNEIKSGKFRLTYVGRYEYKDTSGRNQWINYCIRLRPAANWRFCHAGNDMSY